MARCVTVFGSESWAESVNVTTTASIVLNAELSTDCQECWLAKEILLVVDFTLLKRNDLRLNLFNLLLFLFLILFSLSLSLLIVSWFITLGIFLS